MRINMVIGKNSPANHSSYINEARPEIWFDQGGNACLEGEAISDCGVHVVLFSVDPLTLQHRGSN